MKCKNRGCSYSTTCRAMTDNAPRIHMPHGDHRFTTTTTGSGHVIGYLDLIGPMEPVTLTPVLHDLDAAMQEIDGLFLYLDTAGGYSLALEHRIEHVAEKKPVVTYAITALSAGLIVGAMSTLFFADTISTIGGWGVAAHVCDGSTPIWVISDDAPQKEPGHIAPAWCDRADLALLQRSLDMHHEGGVKMIARGRGIALGPLRSVLDGRMISGKTALRYGLIDACLPDENQAKHILAQLLDGGTYRCKKNAD